MYVCMYVCMHACTYICMCVSMCVHFFMVMYVFHLAKNKLYYIMLNQCSGFDCTAYIIKKNLVIIQEKSTYNGKNEVPNLMAN